MGRHFEVRAAAMAATAKAKSAIYMRASKEIYAAAKSGRYKLCTLTKRYAQAQLPTVKIVDMLLDPLDGQRAGIIIVVGHNDVVACGQKFHTGVAADVAGAAGNQDRHNQCTPFL